MFFLGAFLVLDLHGGPPPPTTVTFQQDVGGYVGTVDTLISESAAAANHGALAGAKWDTDEPSGSGLDEFVLIRFDNVLGNGAGQVPVGATVTSATLTYTVFNSGHNAAAYESAVDWDESSTFNGFGGTPGVQAAEFANFVNTATGGSTGNHSIDVTASMARAALGPASHRGWIMVPINFNGVEIRTREYATVSSRPKLSVTYTLEAVAPELVRRPYLQQATPNSIVIAWRTSTLTDARVRYGPSPMDLTNVVTDADLTNNHVITLSGLQPGVTYYYDIGTTSQALAGADLDHHFVTSPPVVTSPPFRAWVFGDSGNGSANQLAVRDAMLAYTAAAPPDFMVIVGDIVYPDGTDSEYTARFFTPYQDTLRNTVSWPVLGNHDGHSAASVWPAGPYYEAYVLPAAGEAGGLASGTEAYYSFDYANVHFIALDSYHSGRNPGSPMLNWLTADLAATTQDWIIAFWHHAPYTHGTHNSDNPTDSDGAMVDMRENVLPILEAGGADLVLCGHSHGYERSYLIDGAYATPTIATGHVIDPGDGRPSGDGPYRKPPGLNPHQGTVYVVAGHGGAPIGGTGGHPVMFMTDIAYGSCLLEIDGNTLNFTNVRSTGVLSDTFHIVKALAGDLDRDGDVDLADATAFVECITGPSAPSASPCIEFDFDHQGDVDMHDFIEFQLAFTGSG